MSRGDEREYQTVILGALLHDVGKFYQRGLERGRGDQQRLGDECFGQYFAENLSPPFSQEEIGLIRSAINNHHGFEKFVTLADWFSAGMERIGLEDEEHGDPSRERLQSVFEKICLGKNNAKVDEYTYNLKPLSLKEREDLFPAPNLPEQDLREEYKSLWEGFVEELKNIPTQNPRSYLNAFYAILQKYTWCIPSAAYKHEPDISLFDHVKTTAAIAGCLYHCEKTGKSTDKEFLKQKEIEGTPPESFRNTPFTLCLGNSVDKILNARYVPCNNQEFLISRFSCFFAMVKAASNSSSSLYMVKKRNIRLMFICSTWNATCIFLKNGIKGV